MVNEKEVQKIAHLSKIKLEGEELHTLTEDFNQILQFVNQIEKVNTEGIKPLLHVLNLENRVRADEPGQSLSNNEVKTIAPEFNAGFIVVPKVIETDT